MAFQLKNFVSIVASMINRMRVTQTLATDFNVGSVARTLVEAPAAEIDQLYQQMFNGLTQAIPVSVFQTFNFSPLPAMAATGTIQIMIASSLTSTLIPAGTQFLCTVSPTVYASTVDITIAAGTTSAAIPVAATTQGSSTNLVQNVSFTVAPSPSGFSSASNVAAFVNGIDAETPSQQQIRFAAYIASLPRGIIVSLYYGMTLANVQDANGNVIEKVVYSNVVEPYLTDNTQPVSLVDCYIHNGVGSTSTALQISVQNVLYGYYDASGVAVPGYKAAGVNLQVIIATEVDVNVSGTITAMTGYSLTDQVINGVTVSGLNTLAAAAIAAYLTTISIGGSALKAKIVELVMDIPGVYNYVPTLPSTDITSTVSQKIMPGTIAV